MRAARAWLARLGEVVFKRRRDSELAAEMESHLQMHIEEGIRAGVAPEEARRRALIALGGVEQTKENYRDSRGFPAFEAVIQDARFGLRMVGKNPGFTAVAVLTLALGIGATTTVFSTIYGALLEPYPYRGADRMVGIGVLGRSGHRNVLGLSFRQFEELKKLDVLDGAVAMDKWDMVSTGDAMPESVRTAHLSDDAFAYFGVPPMVGRPFSAASTRFDEVPEHVVVLSYPFWQRRYGGSTDVIGKALELDRQSYVIFGVMPPRFRWENVDVYTPLAKTSDPNRIYLVDARLKAGVSHEQAEAVMQPLLEGFAKETPSHFPPVFRANVRSLIDSVVGNFRGALFLLFGAVAVLLAVGCANVSILFLARGTARLHEFAVRAALGANRKRLAAQLLTESLALAVTGGIAGVLLAIGGMKAVVDSLPNDTFPPEAVIHLNIPVLAFSTVVAVATGIFFGISPALQFSIPRLNELMSTAAHRATTGSRSRRTQRFLVAFQVALTIVLLTAAGSAVRSFLALYHTKLGYDPHNVLTADISLPDGNYTTYETRAAFYSAIHKRVAESPGVRSAAVAFFPIPPAEIVRQALEIMGQTAEKGHMVNIQETSGEYFATLGIPLERGRIWSVAENNRAAHVAVINNEMARRFWPNGDPIGQRIRFPEFKAFSAWIVAAKDSNGWLEIIGVVGDTPNSGLREPIAPEAYLPYTLLMGDSLKLVIRTAGAPMNMVRAVREQIHSVDPGQPVAKAQTAEELLRAEGWAREQFVASLFLAFAIVALALASTGLYSVVSYATALRTQEFGIRIALGAQKPAIVRLVLSSVVKTVSLGIGFGIALSIGCKSLIAHWVSGSINDPIMLGAMALLLFGVAGVAAFLPAQRAMRVDPAIALRHE